MCLAQEIAPLQTYHLWKGGGGGGGGGGGEC